LKNILKVNANLKSFQFQYFFICEKIFNCLKENFNFLFLFSSLKLSFNKNTNIKNAISEKNAPIIAVHRYPIFVDIEKAQIDGQMINQIHTTAPLTQNICVLSSFVVRSQIIAFKTD
jgi:hypothetical protein